MRFLGHRPLSLIAIYGAYFFIAISCAGAQESSQKPQTAPSSPELKQRPLTAPEGERAVVEGRMRLDVVVTDATGNPVAGLEAKDFSLADNSQAQEIVSFQAADGAPGKADSRVSLFLMMDTVNSGLVDIGFMREEVEKFLRQNGGHLAQPTTVLVFTDSGFEVVGKTSLDGNTLGDAVHAIKPVVHTIHSAAGGEALLERFQLSGRALGAITAREVPVPGRKMMVWIGPGWPVMRREELNYNARSHELNFDAIASLTNHLRQARMVLCSAGGGTEFSVQDLLKPVKAPLDASSANLAVQVLAIHSGGRTLDAGNRSRPAEQLNTCVQEIGAHYTLTFDPPQGEKAFTYHSLTVAVDKPGLKVNTTAGYYAEP